MRQSYVFFIQSKTSHFSLYNCVTFHLTPFHICAGEKIKMPYSLQQLDLHYQSACEKIKDCKEFTLEHLKTTIAINLQDFFDGLEGADLEKYEREFVVIEDAIQQCRKAMSHEKSRRSFQVKIVDKTMEHREKTMKQLAFKESTRLKRLKKASPYPSVRRDRSVED